jgi:hypothetical protein
VPTTVQYDEEFFTIRSRSVHLRLLPSQCNPRDPEFHLKGFTKPGLNTDVEQFVLEETRGDREGTSMGDTVVSIKGIGY